MIQNKYAWNLIVTKLQLVIRYTVLKITRDCNYV